MTVNLPGLVSGFLSDANRPIRLRLFDGGDVLDDLMLVKYASGAESICGGFEYSLLCVSPFRVCAGAG